MAIEPTGDQIREFRDADHDGPVVMLNLLRFRPDGGREQYRDYARAVGELLPTVGAQVVFHGRAQGSPLVADVSGPWDEVLVVRYPSRQAFLQMLADPAYREISDLRSRALDDAVLQPLTAS